jgi:urease accessory protein
MNSLPELGASLSGLAEYAKPYASLELCAGDLSDMDLQRAEGSCRIALGGSAKGTRIMDVFQFPRVGGGAIQEAIVVNTAGGIAGRDRLESEITVLANGSITVTSQAAEKVYRALNEPARIATKLKASAAAKPAWLPQETIIFDWARVTRQTEIDFCSGAEVLALEWLVLGRAATVRS